jgi:hypothetical protein
VRGLVVGVAGACATGRRCSGSTATRIEHGAGGSEWPAREALGKTFLGKCSQIRSHCASLGCNMHVIVKAQGVALESH